MTSPKPYESAEARRNALNKTPSIDVGTLLDELLGMLKIAAESADRQTADSCKAMGIPPLPSMVPAQPLRMDTCEGLVRFDDVMEVRLPDGTWVPMRLADIRLRAVSKQDQP